MKPGKGRSAILVAIGGTGFRALAMLRGLRYSGTEKLGLLETIKLARAQGERYKAWCSKPTPIRRVQVWAQGRAVMTVEPDEMSILRSFRFDVPSPQNAVVQIVKADEGEAPVVLSNVPLESVSGSGIDEVTSLPNGQQIRLKIVSAEHGRFDIMVVFAPSQDRPQAVAEPRTAKAKAANVGSGTLGNIRTYMPTLLPQPRIHLAAYACGFVILMVAAAYGFGVFKAGESRARRPVVVVEDRSASLTTTTTMPTAPPGSGTQPVAEHTFAAKIHTHETLPQQQPTLSIVSGSSCSVEQASDTIRHRTAKNQLPLERPVLRLPQPITATGENVAAVINKPTEDSSEPQVLKPLTKEGEETLLTARYVRVGVDRTSKNELGELNVLRDSFVRQLDTKSRWDVASTLEEHSQATALFTVGFDPDGGSCLGIVTVQVTDLDGKVFWKAYINCKAIPKGDHGSMFAVAAARLIAKLQEPLKPKDDSGENGN